MEMRKRLTWCGLASACVFAVGVLLTADAQDTGQVTVSVSTEGVGITITGGNVQFGGPHSGDKMLRTHPNDEIFPPVVTNTGNVTIGRIEVAYDGPAGAEAMCDGGNGSWSAHASSVAVDQFLMRALVSTNQTGFPASAGVNINPTSGSGNAFRNGEVLAPGGDVDLFLALWTPQASTTGAQGCTIGLTVTAAAS
jgi:hypothetical protein